MSICADSLLASSLLVLNHVDMYESQVGECCSPDAADSACLDFACCTHSQEVGNMHTSTHAVSAAAGYSTLQFVTHTPVSAGTVS